MSVIQSDYRAAVFPLSVSFRCPVSIIRRARFRAPHMKWIANAPEGEVRELDHWKPSAIPDGSAIICRNNAPLIKLSFRLIKAGRGVKLLGFDIGPQLVKTMKKLGPMSMLQAEVLRAINSWETEMLAKKNSASSISDRADCMRVFAAEGDTLAEACAYADHLFKASGPIELLSGHKSKGLEWDTVLHLDPWRIPSQYAEGQEEVEQELNIRYVIETRPKKSLYLITMEGMQDEV
jgi:hypothetical protein